MLTTLPNLRQLEAAAILRLEVCPGMPEIAFSPVREWQAGEDGKNRPTGAQIRLGGMPLWQTTARLADFKYGQPVWRDEPVFIAADTQPALAVEVEL